MLIVLLTVVQNLGHCQLTLLYTLLIFLAVLMILKLGLIQQLLHIIHTANFQMHGFFQIDYLCLHILNLLLQFSLTFCLLDQLKVEFFVETVQISEFIPQLFNSFYVNSVLLKLCHVFGLLAKLVALTVMLGYYSLLQLRFKLLLRLLQKADLV